MNEEIYTKVMPRLRQSHGYKELLKYYNVSEVHFECPDLTTIIDILHTKNKKHWFDTHAKYELAKESGLIKPDEIYFIGGKCDDSPYVSNIVNEILKLMTNKQVMFIPYDNPTYISIHNNHTLRNSDLLNLVGDIEYFINTYKLYMSDEQIETIVNHYRKLDYERRVVLEHANDIANTIDELKDSIYQFNSSSKVSQSSNVKYFTDTTDLTYINRYPTEAECYDKMIDILKEMRSFDIITSKTFKTMKGHCKRRQKYAILFLRKYPEYFMEFATYCSTELHLMVGTCKVTFNEPISVAVLDLDIKS